MKKNNPLHCAAQAFLCRFYSTGVSAFKPFAATLFILCFVSGNENLFAQKENPLVQLVSEKKSSLNFKKAAIFQSSEFVESSGRSDQPVARFTRAAISPAALRDLYVQNYPALELAIPYRGGELALELVQVEIFTPDFQVIESSGGDHPVPYQPGRYYRGVVKGDDRSLVAVSIFENEISGVVSTDADGNINIVKAATKDRENSTPNGYLIYSDKNLQHSNTFSCFTEKEDDAATLSRQISEAESQSYYCWDKYIGVYLELDNAFVNSKGGTIPSVNYVSSVFNVMASIYWYEGINLRIPVIYVWTTTDDYAVYNNIDIDAERKIKKLDLFRNKRHYIGTGLVWGANLAHLISASPTQAGGGRAVSVDGLCQPEECYAISEFDGQYLDIDQNLFFSTDYSYDVCCIAHEIGHNLGSPHTQSCNWPGGPIDGCVDPENGSCPPGPIPPNGGTIMSYCDVGPDPVGINFNNGFGPLPGALIRQKVCNEAGCLLNTWNCNPPTGISTSNISSCGATVNWNTTSMMQYNLRYKPAYAPPDISSQWVYINNILPPYHLDGLDANTFYEIEIQTNCGYLSLYGSWHLFQTKCEKPSAVIVEYVTDHRARLSWINYNSGSIQSIHYSANGAEYTTELYTSYIELEYLQPDTYYSGYVSSVCECGESFPQSFGFKTEKACPAPTDLHMVSNTCQSITMSWTKHPNVEHYVIHYKRAIFSSEWETIPAVNPPCTITGLIIGSWYEMWVEPSCSQSPNSSAQNQEFIVVPTVQTFCCPPDSLRATNITPTSAVLKWDPYPTPAIFQYIVHYRKIGSPFVIVPNGLQTSRYISGLTPGAVYEFRVMSICSGGATFTPWVGFSTPSNAAMQGLEHETTTNPGNNTPGFPEAGIQEIVLSPNPVADNCLISLNSLVDDAGGSIELLDMFGRQWLKLDWNTAMQPMKVSLSHLPAGSYVVQYTDTRGRRSQKVLVKI